MTVFLPEINRIKMILFDYRSIKKGLCLKKYQGTKAHHCKRE